MVNDVLANGSRAAHDWGLASYLGGVMFGKFALPGAVRALPDKTDRGTVTNRAWNGYSAINAVSLAAVAGGWAAARATEARPDRLTQRERLLATIKDGFVASTVVSGALSGVQGARLAKQGPNGAVPMETGVIPAEETPSSAARIQRSLGWLGNLSIASGVGLVITNAILAQTDHSRPPLRRAVLRRNR